MEWYNNEHRHSGINYVTPSQRHMGLDQEILRKRKEVYEKQKKDIQKMGKRNQILEFFRRRMAKSRQEAETKKETKSREIKRKENRVG